MSDRTCLWCQKSLEGRPKARYCNNACSQSSRYYPGATLAERLARKCEVCGAPMEQRVLWARFCSVQCSAWTRQRKDCPRPGTPRECLACGADLQTGAHGKVKYCSTSCGDWARAHPRVKRKIRQECLQCAASLEHRNSRTEYCSVYCAAQARKVRNPEAVRQAARDSRNRTRVRLRERSRERRQRERENPGWVSVTAWEWRRILRQYGWRCAYCDESPIGALTLDHVIPIAKGGRHAPGNVVPACARCNQSKRDRFLSAWRYRLGRGYRPTRFN